MEAIIYSKADCIWCTRAKELLASKNISFTVLVLGEDYTLEELLEVVPNARTVPQIFLLDSEAESTYIGGFKQLEEQIKEFLK